MITSNRSLPLFATTFRSLQHLIHTQVASNPPSIAGLFLATLYLPKVWLYASGLSFRNRTKATQHSLHPDTFKGLSAHAVNCPLLVILAHSSVENGPALTTPWYLLALLPTLNFLLLYLYLRFAPWYILYGVMAFLFWLARYFPTLYAHVWDIPLIVFGLLLLRMIPEILFLACLTVYYDIRNMHVTYYVFNCPPGNALLFVRLLNRMDNNRPSVRRIASSRIVDVLASGLPLILYFLR